MVASLVQHKQAKVHSNGGWEVEIGSLKKCRAFFHKHPLRLQAILG